MKNPSTFKYQVSDESRPLKAFALKLTRDMDDANDLVQDTLLKAFSNEDKFKTGTNLKGWLYTIMKNIFINKYRRAMKSNIFNDPTDNQFFINSTEKVHQNGGEGNLVMKDIDKALGGIKENLKTPFLMSYRGYKYEEISKSLNIPLGTVKVRIHNARKELMKQLEVYRPKS